MAAGKFRMISINATVQSGCISCLPPNARNFAFIFFFFFKEAYRTFFLFSIQRPEDTVYPGHS